MSSHREAPGISKDPVADSTDLYAFVSPDDPDSVTIIANYIPLEGPAGGPNFYEFGDDVLYEIVIDNDADGDADITYQFRFKNHVKNAKTFLYNTGPITALDSPNWNRTQTYTITRIDEHGKTKIIGAALACPPVNIGPRSTPKYGPLAQSAVHTLGGGIKVFAGQRREGFFVDLGSIFDLGDLRPFQNLHLIPTAAAPGVDATKDLNVHTIAMQIQMTSLTKDGSKPTDPLDPRSVIGVYTSAHRRKARILVGSDDVESGPWVQVSRLGNPLVNEVLIPMARKDYWNGQRPHHDSQFLSAYAHPELAGLLPVLYPGVFPHLAAYSKARVDLEAILLTGIPAGIVPGFQNSTGSTAADLLRLNMAIPPASKPSPLGILGGDLAGFPNGRRVADDVVTIEIRAVAGLTIPLVDPSFTPDGAAGLVTQGLTPSASRYQDTFPYLGVPLDGFDNPS
ncbi:MAG: DUF4331 domain-containing protein [Candidatus Limnocylindrales bacterium]